VFDTVKVAPETFQSIMFMGCAARKEFTRDNRPSSEKPQKVTADGVPLWAVQVAAVTWRGTPQLISVTVPMQSDPATKFRPGDPVQLGGLVFGVTTKREGGYVTWCSSDSIDPASVASVASV
jgi:hypothetical protein